MFMPATPLPHSSPTCFLIFIDQMPSSSHLGKQVYLPYLWSSTFIQLFWVLVCSARASMLLQFSLNIYNGFETCFSLHPSSKTLAKRYLFFF
jgi:hypothetical protein